MRRYGRPSGGTNQLIDFKCKTARRAKGDLLDIVTYPVSVFRPWTLAVNVYEYKADAMSMAALASRRRISDCTFLSFREFNDTALSLSYFLSMWGEIPGMRILSGYMRMEH